MNNKYLLKVKNYYIYNQLLSTWCVHKKIFFGGGEVRLHIVILKPNYINLTIVYYLIRSLQNLNYGTIYFSL